ncbi:hypothetical protein BFJ72_g12915 [Fusarium proliferatum]|uniref:Hydrophobin n=1 Tax=Gibberella intermedia TaxID=948311 RepID=A0A365NFA8_GIBIN|nr:hypothetical protein FPRO05_10147 [Fusarium proliferatum]RKL27787.1 hypothetical protein BFJ72_g12915 [Fusarium proliferatum]
MKVFSMLVLPALALGAATPKATDEAQVHSLDLGCLGAAPNILDCVGKITQVDPLGATDCITKFVTGIIGCVPGLSSLSDIPGFPSLPTGADNASQPAGTPATPAIPSLPAIPGLV